MRSSRDTTKPFYVAVPRGGQGVSLDSFKATLNNNKCDYWILGKPHPYTKPPEPQLFERAHCVAIATTTSHMERANAQFAQRQAAESHQGTDKNPKKKEQKEVGPAEIAALERQLEDAGEVSQPLALSLEEKKVRVNELQRRYEGLEALHKEATDILERTKNQLNTCEALNPSGECLEIVSKIAASGSEVERQKLLTLYTAASKAGKLQNEKKLLVSEAMMLGSEKRVLEYAIGTVYCRCLLEFISNDFIKLHQENKPPDCPWPHSEDLRPNGLPIVTSTADHIAAPCFDLQSIGFPASSGLADLWKKLAGMIHQFSGGTVFIPAGALLGTEQELVRQLAKRLERDTETIPETP
ncbi:hypothetical protein QOT17_023442 [Balamuthia mandrillaris]